MAETIWFNSVNSYYSDKVGIEIRKQGELSENEKRLLEKSGLRPWAEAETWTALGTNQQLAYGTHGIFRYFGKFPPPIATYMITKFTDEGDLVIDPMCGSGTTGLEAAVLRRRCILNDLNPFSMLLAKAKTTRIEEAVLTEKMEFIKQNYRPLTREEYDFVPVALRDPDHWFLKRTSDSLRGIKWLIEQETDPDLKDFLNVILAATVRRVSRATTQQGRLFLDAETALEDAFPTFIKRYEIGMRGLAEIPEDSDIRYYNGDVKDLPELREEHSARLIILHPPYFNSYKYTSVNSLEMGWLGYDRNEYNKKELKEFFKVGNPDNSEKYAEDMSKALTNALGMLRAGGILGLMIGDTIMKGNYIPVTKMVLERTDLADYKVETVAIRVPKYTEATWVASQRRDSNNIGITLSDYIILIRREK